jgi:hypothetical protein
MAFDADSYGIDADVAMADVPGVLGLASGLRNLGNSFVRRISCPPGGLWYDDDYSDVDIWGMLNQDLSQADVARYNAAISATIEKDERVRACAAAVVQDTPNQAANISLIGTLVTGQPFAFVMRAQDATVTLLAINGVSVAAAVTGVPAAPGVQLRVGPVGVDGGPGPTGPAGASGTPQLTTGPLGGPSAGYDDTGTEQVVDQFWVNFDALPGTVTIQLIADCFTTGAATGTYRIRVGGTRGNADGTLVGTPATATTGTPTQKSISATIANPTGIRYLTVTAQTDTPGEQAVIAQDRALTIR